MPFNVYTQHGCPVATDAIPADALCAIMGHRFGDSWVLNLIDRNRGIWRLDVFDSPGHPKPLNTRIGELIAMAPDAEKAMERIFKYMHLDGIAFDLGVFVAKI